MCLPKLWAYQRNIGWEPSLCYNSDKELFFMQSRRTYMHRPCSLSLSIFNFSSHTVPQTFKLNDTVMHSMIAIYLDRLHLTCEVVHQCWITEFFFHTYTRSYWVGNTGTLTCVVRCTCNIWLQWNLSNLDTLGTISGVHFMVSWFQGLVNMQMQHLGPQ